MLGRRDVIQIGLSGLVLTIPGLARAQANGQFSEFPVLQSMPGDKFRLVEELRYRDPAGTLWVVPKNFVSDGASIPRVLWSVGGGPWSGSYKDAAVVHDRYCVTMERSWEATHRMFYDAMRSRGVSESEATQKYWAVYNFGPRWDAHYRWTSALELYKKPRSPLTHAIAGHDHAGATASVDGGGGDDTFAIGASQSPASSNLTESNFLALQQREFALASKRIAADNLGPDDVPGLAPDLAQ
jgi:hypothetical protein